MDRCMMFVNPRGQPSGSEAEYWNGAGCDRIWLVYSAAKMTLCHAHCLRK